MKNFKKVTAFVLSLLMLTLLLASCTTSAPTEVSATTSASSGTATTPAAASSNPSTQASTSGKKYVIGICLNNITNPFRVVDYQAGIKWFDTHPNYSFVQNAAANDVTKQIANMEDLIAMKCDAIVINCINEDSMKATLQRAKDAGIPVFAWDRDITNEAFRAGVVKKDNYTDYFKMGQTIAKDMNGKGNVVLMLGFAGNAVTEEAHKGLLDAFKDYPDIKIVNTSYCSNSRAEALKVFESVYLANQGVTCVVGENDEVALGVLQVLQTQNRKDVLVYGHDGEREAYEAIKAGTMKGTASNPMDMLYSAIDMASKYLETGKIDQQKIFKPTTYVTKDNVDQFYNPNSKF